MAMTGRPRFLPSISSIIVYVICTAAPDVFPLPSFLANVDAAAVGPARRRSKGAHGRNPAFALQGSNTGRKIDVRDRKFLRNGADRKRIPTVRHVGGSFENEPGRGPTPADGDGDGDAETSERTSGTATAVFGTGCFWGGQDDFARLPGVVSVRTGYGRLDDGDGDGDAAPPPGFLPSYVSVVLLGNPGPYAECVEVTYDRAAVSYVDLLRLFWASRDPTEPSAWTGQYRSALWPGDHWERAVATREVEEARREFAALGKTVGTVVVADGTENTFVPAEPFHQHFWPKAKSKVLLLSLAYGIPHGCSGIVDWWEKGLGSPGVLGMGEWIGNDIYWTAAVWGVLAWIFVENAQLAKAGVQSFLTIKNDKN